MAVYFYKMLWKNTKILIFCKGSIKSAVKKCELDTDHFEFSLNSTLAWPKFIYGEFFFRPNFFGLNSQSPLGYKTATGRDGLVPNFKCTILKHHPFNCDLLIGQWRQLDQVAFDELNVRTTRDRRS